MESLPATTEKVQRVALGSGAWKKSGAATTIEEREEGHGYTLKELDAIGDDPEKWGFLHGKVTDLVTREPVPFKPRPLQRRLFAHYRQCQAKEKPCRVVMCKVRRGGGSTGSEAILYVHAHNYNARLGAIGTDHQVAMNMFKFMETFNHEDDFPGWSKASKKLETGHFDWPNGSSWEKYTAENPEAARSAGLQGYHATEVGRWQEGGAQDARETLKSMLGSVPKRGFTVVIEESTAAGAAGAFYERWQGARWPSAAELECEEGQEYWRKWESETPQNMAELGRDLQFVRCFAAWFEDDENSQPVSEEDIALLKRTMDDKERELQRRYEKQMPHGPSLGDRCRKATIWEQLSWRRTVIQTEFEGDVEGFEQEYPSSPKEAFASSGRHTFNVEGCAWMLTLAKSSHPEVGILTMQNDGGVAFTRTDASEGWLLVWEMPREGMSYIAAVDTMEGAEQIKGSKTHDYHAGILLRAAYVDDDGKKHATKVAATLAPRSTVEPDVLVKQMDLLHRFYGRCMVVPEVNRSGYAFILHAKQLGMNLFRREKLDRFTSEATDIVGWETTDKSRPQLISAMQAAIRCNARQETRDDGLECVSVTVASECATMVKNAKGKDEAAHGAHDDHVIACGMALVNISGATYYSHRIRRRRGPPDRKLWKRFR
jgi:hypothetical protein